MPVVFVTMMARLLEAASLVWLVGAPTAAAPLEPAFGSKPHLVFILQDDLGHFDVAFSGNKAAALITANITKLASEGVILNNHYVHWHCSPTRRSFLSGRLPVHHHEQLSDDATDDLDLRYTWISGKLKQAGYQSFWFGKGHTGYKSVAHLPTHNGFDRFVGFLSGSQSYTSTDRWEGDHPLNTDAEFTNPPRVCVPGAVPDDIIETVAQHARATGPGAVCARALELACDADRLNHTVCLSCAANQTAKANCTNTEIGRFCSEAPPPRPHPQPPQHNDSNCHADTYSTTLYGELCLAAIAAHDKAGPFFLYFPIQAVHGPYDAVPFNPIDDTYMGMLWDSDVYVGAIVNLLKKKAMYENTLLVYSADNGAGGGPPHLAPGTGTGLNWPLRGEKHTNWEGGLKAAAFVGGGLVPAQLRGTSSDVNCHIVGATFD